MTFTFYIDCPYCQRRITARSTVGLRDAGDKHVARCRPRALKRIKAKQSKDVQGDLFGGDK